MKSINLVAIVLSVVSLSAAFPYLGKHVNGQLENGGKIWVLLAAGSNYYFNYRHQADVCHAYQVVHEHGIPDEQIIVMMYDDIAYATDNPHKGVVINRPGGPNVYKNVPKDYTGKNVDKFHFLNVLKGDKQKLKGIGSERVIESGPNDHIFVYFSDHGGESFVLFPGFDRLYADQLSDALKYMHQSKRYSKLVFYLEACESGSMFDGILPADMNVYAVTAANSKESSWATYCEDEQIKTCLGDEFSVAWLENSEKNDINSLLLENQFERILNGTPRSHPQRFGNLTIAKTFAVGQFLGNKRLPAEESLLITEKPTQVSANKVLSRDVPLELLKMKIKKAETQEEAELLTKQLNQMRQKRKILENTMENIILSVAKSDSEAQQFLHGSTRAMDSMDCYKTLTTHFFDNCFPQSSYALPHMKVFANLCNFGITEQVAIEAMDMICPKTISEVL